MKTAIKIIAVLVVLLIVGVVGLVMFGLSQIDKIAKIAVEEGGTYALQVDTTVTEVDVNLTGGSATMTGLNIANPDGLRQSRSTINERNKAVKLRHTREPIQ